MVRMRTADRLHLSKLQPPFGVLALAFDPHQQPAAIERLQTALLEAGASPIRGVGGPGADLWEEGILAAVANLRVPKEAIEFYFGGTVLGMGMAVTDFLVLALDADDAAWRDTVDATRSFLSRRADWRLHAAADAGREADVRQAIEAGWPIEEFDSDLAETPLHMAARHGHLGIMRMLLAAGADVNRRCEERIGETPLGLVADTCSLAVASMLLEAGADPTIRGWMGLTALDRAAARTDEVGKAVLSLLATEARRRRP
jgi:hypothetical protein